MSKTSIEWTQSVWNVLSGCSRKSDGCKNCYAETMTKRLEAMGSDKYTGLLNEHGRFNGVIKFDAKALLKPLSVKKPTTYFVNSMSDLFHENVKDEWIDKVFAVMALCPQHTFQILTKRADRMHRYFDLRIYPWIFDHNLDWWGNNYPEIRLKLEDWACESGSHILPNVHLGVSCENQQTADERIPFLLDTPAAIRFLSCEPLLGEIDLWKSVAKFYESKNIDWVHAPGYLEFVEMLDWVIVGGESGHNARPCDIAWIRSIVEQCKDAGTAVFVKQLGAKPFVVGEKVDDFDGLQCVEYSQKPIITNLMLKSKKGGDINEFPQDLQIREMPR